MDSRTVHTDRVTALAGRRTRTRPSTPWRNLRRRILSIVQRAGIAARLRDLAVHRASTRFTHGLLLALLVCAKRMSDASQSVRARSAAMSWSQRNCSRWSGLHRCSPAHPRRAHGWPSRTCSGPSPHAALREAFTIAAQLPAAARPSLSRAAGALPADQRQAGHTRREHQARLQPLPGQAATLSGLRRAHQHRRQKRWRQGKPDAENDR